MFDEYKTLLHENVIKFENFHMRRHPDIIDVNGLPFHFDYSAKNIGINFSGGADSTMLFYILCQIIKDENLSTKIHPIHNIRFYKEKPWLPKMAMDCYKWLKLRFGNTIQPIQYGFIPTELEVVKLNKLDQPQIDLEFNADHSNCDVLITQRYNEFVQDMLQLEWIYTGTTTNPPLEHDKAPEFRNIEFTKNNVDFVITRNTISPFALLTKDWVMAQYKNYDILDLLDLTRSCEADLRVYNLETWKSGDRYPEPCGTCFFCQERQWGLENSKKWQ